jgi:DNA-binding NarL/FixJ family response regulator
MQPLEPVRIALVDDHVSARLGFGELLRCWPRGQVVLEADDGVDYEERCATLPTEEAGTPPIQIAIVDLQMPRRDGVATIAWIRVHQPRTLPIAISFDPFDLSARQAMEVGAATVWGNDIRPARLCTELDAFVASGLRLPPLRTAKPKGPHLTEREHEVITRLNRYPEPSIPQLADEMDCAPRTVDAHRANLYTKLGVHSRLELHYKAVQQGLITCACKLMRWKRDELG